MIGPVLIGHLGNNSNRSRLREVCREWREIHDTWVGELKLVVPRGDDRDLRHLESLLSSRPNLRVLEFDGFASEDGRITELVSKAVRRNALRELKMVCAACGPSTFRGLASPRLQRLDLSYNDFSLETTEALARCLLDLPALQKLRINYSHVGPRGAAALAPSLGRLSALRHLDLGRNYIGTEGAGALASLEHLEHLDLSENGIGLTPIPVARLHLNLGGNAVDVGSLVLPASLVHLDLSSTCLHVGSLASFDFTSLRSLDLSFNVMGVWGAAALAAVLTEGMAALRELDLGGNVLGSAGVVVLAPAFERLRKLHLGCNDIGPEGAAALRRL